MIVSNCKIGPGKYASFMSTDNVGNFEFAINFEFREVKWRLKQILTSRINNINIIYTNKYN